VKQVISELKNGPFVHAASGTFQANAARLTPAALALILTRACGALAVTFHARAACATIRNRLIYVPARLARRRTHHHLPSHWPRQ
jgi:hypothetical protein